MDFMDLLASAGVTTTGVAIILLVYRFLKSIHGKKLVSSCCGKKMEVGFQVSEMTPTHRTKDEFVVVNPIVLSPPPATASTDKVESAV
jgi:hypothetical protein